MTGVVPERKKAPATPATHSSLEAMGVLGAASGAQQTLGPRASYRPQGTCPKPWVATIDGEALFDGRGGVRRFKTEAAAQDAAVRKHASRAKATGSAS